MRWTIAATIGSLPTPRGGHTLSVVGERVYLFGGCTFSNSSSSSLLQQATTTTVTSSPGLVYLDNEVSCLDLHTLSWSVVCSSSTNGPSKRYAHSSAVVGASILIFGGYNAKETYLGDLWCFDTTSKAWRELTPRSAAGNGGGLPSARYAHTSVTVGHVVYVFGGCAELTCFRDMWALDTAAMVWMRLPSRGTTPSPRAYHVAVAVGRSILVFGGRAGAVYFNDMYAFDIDSATWSKVEQHGTIPPEMAYHTAVVIGGKVVVYGGMDGKNLLSHLSVFNPSSLTWERIEPDSVLGAVVPPPRHKHAAISFGPCMLVFGGMGFPPTAFGDSLVLETSTPSPSQLQFQSPPPQQQVKQEPMNTTSIQQQQQQRVSTQQQLQQQQQQQQLQLQLQQQQQIENSRYESELNELKLELGRCYKEISKLHGKDLDGLSYSDLETLELTHIESLKIIAIAKRNAIEAEVNRRMIQQESQQMIRMEEMQRQIDEMSATKQLITTSPVTTNQSLGDKSQLQAKLEEIQGMLTTEQNKNLKLRRRMRSAGIDPDDLGSLPNRRRITPQQASTTQMTTGLTHQQQQQQQIGVGWGTVEMREYEPAQSRDSVPSSGAAPLGLGDNHINMHRERIEGFERRRETERKGVSRVPEEQRREVLARAGVPTTAIETEADALARVNWGRIESLASPTDNPLPDEQRQAYKRFVDSA